MGKALCEGIASYRIYDFELSDITTCLVKVFPEITLNIVFAHWEDHSAPAPALFRHRIGWGELSLNVAPVDRLLNWCNGDQSRIEKLASVVDPYIAVEPGPATLDNPKRVALSEHIRALMDAAGDKLSIVETMFTAVQPTSWSGSLADILEVRSVAFAELLKYPRHDVRERAKEKLDLIKEAIVRQRDREARENTRREQRFE